MKIFITLALAALVFTAAACDQTASTPSNSANNRSANQNTAASKPAVDRAAEEASLKATDLAWAEAATRKDVDATVGFMAEDGATLPPTEPIARGKEAIKKGWVGLLGLKDLNIKWDTTIVQVSESGDIGYTSGAYTLEYTDDKGAKVNDKGKYLEVWKKVDGKWKCYLDMYNSDLPAAK